MKVSPVETNWKTCESQSLNFQVNHKNRINEILKSLKSASSPSVKL